jgi:hypothetical protein
MAFRAPRHRRSRGSRARWCGWLLFAAVTAPPTSVAQALTGAEARAPVCVPPIAAVDTASASRRVGNGTAASCTEEALRSAIAAGPVVAFACGPAPVSIAISGTIEVPAERDTVIDGGGLVTLDGQHATRILSVRRANYRSNSRGLTLQRIRLVNGRAPGTGFVAPDPARPRCAAGFAGGSGGAILVVDARLHLIDVEFADNEAASPGPDVGGGAVYAAGSLDVTVLGSRFVGNRGANAGALGLLQSNARIVDSVFIDNRATGTGQNFAGGEAAGCPGVGHPEQGGAGGNGGAITVDGSDDTDIVVCGSRFIGNQANELAGAFFRTMNRSPRRTVFDRTLFQGNRAKQGGAAFVLNAAPLEVMSSAFVDNRAEFAGAAQFSNSRMAVVNSTFAANVATRGMGGALFLGNPDGASSVLNTTFADNRSIGGPGYFAGAIAGGLGFAVRNTVFANNTSADAGSPMQCQATAPAAAGNVQWPRERLVGGRPDTPCTRDIVFVDPGLAPLRTDGGPTPGLAPGPSSPLRGTGRDCPRLDQRGRPRGGGVCTAGAVE